MKKIFYAGFSLLLFSFIIPSSTSNIMKSPTIYQFKVPALTGGTIDFSQFKEYYKQINQIYIIRILGSFRIIWE